MTRLGNSETRLDSVANELRSIQKTTRYAPHFAELEQQLKQVELSVTELHEKVGRVQVEVKMDRAVDGGKIGESIAARVGWLEVEFARLKSEIFNTEMPNIHGNEFVEVLESKPKFDAFAKPQLPTAHRRASATE